MYVHVVPATKHFVRVAVKIAEIVFVLKRPTRDLRTRGLFPHERHARRVQRLVARTKCQVLILAHGQLRLPNASVPAAPAAARNLEYSKRVPAANPSAASVLLATC